MSLGGVLTYSRLSAASVTASSSKVSSHDAARLKLSGFQAMRKISPYVSFIKQQFNIQIIFPLSSFIN